MLLDLANRCEQATAPDRELDALIWCALNGKRYSGHHEAYAAYGRHNQETQVEYTEPPKRTRLVTGHPRLPHAKPVTSSLDAAMTLVPEGFQWSVAWVADGVVDATCHPVGGRCGQGHFCATPASALTAACLRAIAAQLKDQEQ